MIIRIAEPIELWDGSQPLEKSIQDFANERDWSLYDLRGRGAPSPQRVLAAFYGNRKGPKPRHHPRYVVFDEVDLLATGGRLERSPAIFNWPDEISAAHVDLIDHQNNPGALFAAYDRGRQLVEVSRVQLHIDMASLAVRANAPGEFRTRVAERLRKLQRSERALFDEIQHGANEQIQVLLEAG